jgi:hypothetical protein
MSSDELAEIRARHAALQEMLARALTGQGEAPAGFDAARVQVAAQALAAKRARGVERSWTGLASALRDGFASAFAAYAEATPLPSEGNPYADGLGFARWLARRGPLPDAGRLELLAAELRFRCQGHGLASRTIPSFAAAWLRQSRSLVVAARWPRRGEWWLTLPLGLGSRFD